MHLEIGFCEHYCVQMTLSIPGTIEKCSLEREHQFLTEFVLNINSCFIQHNVLLVEYINAAQKINSFCQERLVFWQFQNNFIFLNDKIQLVCISLEVHTYFYRLYIVHFKQDISSLESVYSMSGNCCISTTVSVSFSGEVFGVVITTW